MNQNKIIKFRVWDGNSFYYTDAQYIGTNELGDYSLNFRFQKDPGYIESKDCWTLQSTGLLDINNKEIYEGDIVSTDLREINLVKWDSVELKWGLEYPDFPKFCEKLSNFKGNIEVIGNVFENPELLNNT